MNNWKIWVAFLSVFAAGILAGVVGFGFVLKMHFGSPPPPGEFHKMIQSHMLEDIKKEVRPDDAAMPEIKAAIEQVMTEMDALRQENDPKVQAIFDKGRERIEAQLTPEQVERFKKLRDKRRKGKFGFFEFPPPPPPMQ